MYSINEIVFLIIKHILNFKLMIFQSRNEGFLNVFFVSKIYFKNLIHIFINLHN